MRSLCVFAVLGIVSAVWTDGRAAAQAELPPELEMGESEEAAPASEAEETAPAEAAEDRPAPLVPPGGVPEVGGPVPGQPEQPEPEPEPPPAPVPPPIYSFELQIRASFPAESSFDRALVDHRYRTTRVVPTGYVGFQVPLVEWLWLGGRIGMRGMSWSHPEREDAAVVAGDLLATAQVRFALGRVLELGVLFGGGVAWLDVRLGGVGSDQATARFIAEGIIAFRPDRHVALGPRFGWEYFQWEGMNSYDHGLDIGGPFFGLSLEGRE